MDSLSRDVAMPAASLDRVRMTQWRDCETADICNRSLDSWFLFGWLWTFFLEYPDPLSEALAPAVPLG